MKRGTVRGVDTAKHVVSATLMDGTNILEAKYIDDPPWVGDVAGFEQVSSNRWVCYGTQGKLTGQGPNIVPGNGDFENAGDDLYWSAGGQLTTLWDFPTTVQSWAANTSATITWQPYYVYTGTGAIFLGASVTGTRSVHSPTGVSGVACAAGDMVTASAWCLGAIDTDVTVHVRLEWYNGATFLSSSAFGTTLGIGFEAWVQPQVTATAPASTTRCAITVEAINLPSGNQSVAIDRAEVSAPGSNTTLGRSTTAAQSGANSLSLTSIAAGICSTRYPKAANQNFGPDAWPVTPGDFWYFAAWWLQANGILPSFVVDYYDSAGNYLSTDRGTDSTPVRAAPSAMAFHSRVTRVPALAVSARWGFDWSATAASQVLLLDLVGVKQCRVTEGGVILLGDSVGTNVGSSLEDTGWLASRPTSSSGASGFPSVVAPKTHVLSRAIHAHRERTTGTQAIANNTPTQVTGMDVTELTGIDTATNGFKILRTGLYLAQGQCGIDDEALPGNSRVETRVKRFQSDGVTQIEDIAHQGHSGPGGSDFGVVMNCSDTRRLNAGDIVVLSCYQINGNAIARTLTTGRAKWFLSLTFMGEL